MTDIIIRSFSTLQPYQSTWQAMQTFTASRTQETIDELWLLEHAPVFTQGLAGKAEHILHPHDIPVVQTDRGGQVTYHGPGQLMLYSLLNLHRLRLHLRPFVRTLEKIIVDYLQALGIAARGDPAAPGVYVSDAKMASMGLRIRRGFSYHGLALNIRLDLTPFSYINPCGFKGLQMTQISDYAPNITVSQVRQEIIPYFLNHFGYNHPTMMGV